MVGARVRIGVRVRVRVRVRGWILGVAPDAVRRPQLPRPALPATAAFL